MGGSKYGDKANLSSSKLPALMRAGKDLAFEDGDIVRSLMGPVKKKSKKEE